MDRLRETRYGSLELALVILRTNRVFLDLGAAKLLAHETLVGDKIPTTLLEPIIPRPVDLDQLQAAAPLLGILRRQPREPQ